MFLELLLISALSIYRFTFMLNSENGPADIFGRLRSRIGVKYDEHSIPYGTNWIAEGVLCFYCLSVWIAFAVTGFLVIAVLLNRLDLAEWCLLPFATSGAAVFLKKWAG